MVNPFLTGETRMKSFSPVLVGAIALLAACSSSGGGSTPDSGSGSGGSATGGSPGTGGVGTGGSGTGGDSGTGGVGTGGIVSGTGGTPTDASSGGDAPTTTDGGGNHPAFTCPAGPFPKQMTGQSMTACNGFKLPYDWAEGPTWVASQGAFFFSSFAHSNLDGTGKGDIIKVGLDGVCSTWTTNVGTNGLAVGPNGNLYGASHKSRAVVEFDINTKAMRIVADKYMGQNFDSPNDLIVHSSGNIYFTNPNYELGPRPAGFGPAVFRIDPAGVVSLLMKVGGQPNGIGLSNDEKKLYVVGAGVWNIDASGAPGTKTGEAAPNADGFAVDCANDIIIQGTNSAFGGPDGKTLLVVSNPPSVKLVQMTVPGFP